MAWDTRKQDSGTNSNRKDWEILGHCCVSLRQTQIHLGRSEKIFAFSLASTFCVSFIALTLCIPSTVSRRFSSSPPSFMCWEMEELQQCRNWLMCLCSWDTAVQAHGHDTLSMEVCYCHGNMHRDILQHLTSLSFAPWSSLAILQMLKVYPTSFLILEFPLSCVTF